MSIVVSVKVYDGVVLGADSMTSLVSKDEKGNMRFVKAYSHAKKLFQVKGLPAGILTYGFGNIGRRSVESYITDFLTESELGQHKTWHIRSISNGLLDFLRKAYSEAYKTIPEKDWPQLGVYVSGYSSKSPLPEEWEFVIPKGKEAKEARATDRFGANWRGVTLPFARLYTGVDPRVYGRLRERRIPEETLETLKEVHESVTSPIVFDGMPIQDAIEFARFILATTVGIAKFEMGQATCGGPLDIALIRRTQPYFTWIQTKDPITSPEP